MNDAGIDLGVIHGPPAPKRKRGRSFKRSHERAGRPAGRPSNEELAWRKRIDQESKEERRQRSGKKGERIVFGPPKPPGLGWGGARKGAGRKRREGPPKTKLAMVRMDRELAAKLESLPRGQRSEYVRQAIELLKDIQPPEKFLASRRQKKETPPGIV